MADPHAPFVIVNRAVNPCVRALLRSPAHGLVSSHLALLTVTGRKSGRTYTIPVGYERHGDVVSIHIDWPERKRWWRNLREPAPVELRLAGERLTGTGVARGDERSGVSVEVRLDGDTRS
jgi:hypothetical protein